jgi:thiol-disulfide isomerase/thioredoxin
VPIETKGKEKAMKKVMYMYKTIAIKKCHLVFAYKLKNVFFNTFLPQTLKGEGIENQPPLRVGEKADFQNRYFLDKHYLSCIFIPMIIFSGLLIESCGGSSTIPSNLNDSIQTINPDSLSTADSIEYAFNYVLNHKPYKLTYFEFGSTGCIECKKMESVMDSVQEAYKNKINVVFYNVRNNKKMTKHFDIKLIPVQILLDKQGKECFRHVGYYSFNDLSKEFKIYESN